MEDNMDLGKREITRPSEEVSTYKMEDHAKLEPILTTDLQPVEPSDEPVSPSKKDPTSPDMPAELQGTILTKQGSKT